MRCPDCGTRDMVPTLDPWVIGCPACGWRERRETREPVTIRAGVPHRGVRIPRPKEEVGSCTR
jgi:hypothetical protein